MVLGQPEQSIDYIDKNKLGAPVFSIKKDQEKEIPELISNGAVKPRLIFFLIYPDNRESLDLEELIKLMDLLQLSARMGYKHIFIEIAIFGSQRRIDLQRYRAQELMVELQTQLQEQSRNNGYIVPQFQIIELSDPDLESIKNLKQKNLSGIFFRIESKQPDWIIKQ